MLIKINWEFSFMVEVRSGREIKWIHSSNMIGWVLYNRKSHQPIVNSIAEYIERYLYTFNTDCYIVQLKPLGFLWNIVVHLNINIQFDLMILLMLLKILFKIKQLMVEFDFDNLCISISHLYRCQFNSEN